MDKLKQGTYVFTPSKELEMSCNSYNEIRFGDLSDEDQNNKQIVFELTYDENDNTYDFKHVNKRMVEKTETKWLPEDKNGIRDSETIKTGVFYAVTDTITGSAKKSERDLSLFGNGYTTFAFGENEKYFAKKELLNFSLSGLFAGGCFTIYKDLSAIYLIYGSGMAFIGGFVGTISRKEPQQEDESSCSIS